MKSIFIWLHIFLEPNIKLSSCVQKNVQSCYSETSDRSVARRPQRGVPKIAEKALLLMLVLEVCMFSALFYLMLKKAAVT